MNPLRRLAERMTRSLVIKRRLPAEFGHAPFYVAADAALGYLRYRLPASELLMIAKTFVEDGMVVWDVGANVGMFTFAAASKCGPKGHVLAIEADIWLAHLIQKSCRIKGNDDFNISVIPAAVSNSLSIEKFLIAKRGRMSNSLEKSGHRSQAGGTRYTHYVPSITLDSLLRIFRPPDVLKIDVEGAEQFVLQGANVILSEFRPIIYCEVGAEQDEEITNILHQHEYRLFDPVASMKREISHCVFNTLAIPNGRTK